jgi:hypothetical protein
MRATSTANLILLHFITVIIIPRNSGMPSHRNTWTTKTQASSHTRLTMHYGDDFVPYHNFDREQQLCVPLRCFISRLLWSWSRGRQPKVRMG